MQAFVPKNRRPKFELHLRIIDLNNVPLVNGTSFVKWHLSHSTAAEHRGRTDGCPVRDHKVQYDYEIALPVRLTVDKNGMLQESFLELEVVQDYSGAGRGERITLGNVKLNLAEYVEPSDVSPVDSDGPGVTRRYLMKESKINSTLKIGIYMKQTEGDKNYIAPALKTAQVFSGIAGIMAGEQAEGEENGSTPSLSTKSREAGELQDMYRRTLAAYWSAQPGELKADECIEDIFAGGDGWGDREKPYQLQRGQTLRYMVDDSSGPRSENETRHMRGSSNGSAHRESHETLRQSDVMSKSSAVRGRGSLEQQALQMKAESERKRHRPHYEVDEFDESFLHAAVLFARADASVSGTQPSHSFSMLASRASNVFVCVRCELRLACQRTPVTARRSSCASFSTSTRRSDAFDDLEAALQPARPAVRIRKEVQPLDRIYKRKGRLIRETSKRLGEGVTRLGDEAEILVLREVGGDDAPAKATPRVTTQAETRVAPDILASLEQERAALTPEDIQARLQSLRPGTNAEPDEPVYVSLKTFITLIRDLTSGFTQQQLSQYYSAAKNVQLAEYQTELLASLKGATGTARHPTTRSDWQPGTTSINKRLPGIDVATRHKRSPVSKQLLVDRIIRDIWKLIPLEEIEALGEIELSLKPSHITLLTSGEQGTLLENISTARRARIEVYQPHSILRITADKTTAEYAANDVEEALQKIELKKVQLKAWIPHLEEGTVPKDKKLAKLYDDDDFRLITSLMRSNIQRMDNANTLIVRGLDKHAVAETERALWRMLPLKTKTVHTVDTQNIHGQTEVYLLPTSYDDKSLSARFRNTALGRWSLPVARKTNDQQIKAQKLKEEGNEYRTTSSEVRSHQIQSVIEGLLQSKPGAPPKPANKKKKKTNKKLPIWSEEPESKLSAEFGQVLYPTKSEASDGASNATQPTSPRPVFTSSVPGLTNVLGCLRPATTSQLSGNPSLVYEFVAAPDQPELEIGQIPPTLHIHLRTDNSGGEATLHKLDLGFQQHVHDVLLPNNAVDVRFTRYGRLRLNGQKIKSVQEWLTVVIANIASGERLSAPEISIPVPLWTVTGTADDGQFKTVKYLFLSVQFRQVVQGRFQDELVTYTTVQSSKMDAQGGALAMYHDLGAVYNDSVLKPFVEKCLEFSDAITSAAEQTQPVAKKLRPRANDSERKQRRLAEQAAEAKRNDVSEEAEVIPERDASQQEEITTEKDAAGQAKGLKTDAPEQAAASKPKDAPVREHANDDVLDMLDDAIEQGLAKSRAASQMMK
ncbi:hypothetical protein ACEQ8H_005687 [Pleosporales sp. CAS-2024a]